MKLTYANARPVGVTDLMAVGEPAPAPRASMVKTGLLFAGAAALLGRRPLFWGLVGAGIAYLRR